jgi:hypothetical protein
VRNSSTTTTYNDFALLSDVIMTTGLLRARIKLDKFRNKLFRYLDKKSARLDELAAKRAASLNIYQYAILRDITKLKFDEAEQEIFDSLSIKEPNTRRY